MAEAKKSTVTPVLLERETHGLGIDCVHCPVCTDGYVHLKRGFPYIENGNDSYETRGGAVRGDVSALRFECENGHEFELCFGFHKGYTFFFCRLPVTSDDTRA